MSIVQSNAHYLWHQTGLLLKQVYCSHSQRLGDKNSCIISVCVCVCKCLSGNAETEKKSFSQCVAAAMASVPVV